jgi:hypothetical protein
MKPPIIERTPGPWANRYVRPERWKWPVIVGLIAIATMAWIQLVKERIPPPVVAQIERHW